jgi:ERCC4-related helicase
MMMPQPPTSPSTPPDPEKGKLELRGYQEYILRRIKENRDKNLLIELDCGLGKRVLTYKLVSELFPETRFILTVNSTSSLQETAQYLEKEYGGVSGLGAMTQRVQGRRRQRMLKESRVVLCTARVLTNVLKRGEFTPQQFDAIVINEVDTILRRVGRQSVLVQPWSYLLEFFKDRWIIGMSGTLRDDHVVLDSAQLQIREELKTLSKFIPNAEVISMDELSGTDVEGYIEPTVINVVSVESQLIKAVSLILDALIKSTRDEIYQAVREERDIEVDAIPDSVRLLHLMLDELPISEDLAQRYSGLLMIRKYLYGMSASSFRRFLHHPVIAPQIDVERILSEWPKVTPKVLKVCQLVDMTGKTVILSSYLHVVSEINRLLSKAGVQALSLTGRTRDKQAVLAEFKESKPPAAIILSPVGERDLDLPETDLLIICDVVNTTKTIYQKMKRSRGGQVIFLAYDGTSEEEKVNRLIDNIMHRYPWSTRLGNTQS